jgi:hypothetical protein
MLTISSFIIRFVCPEPSTESSADDRIYHGMIRHIQSNQEMAFSQWKDAVAFIQSFVPAVAEEVPRRIEEGGNQDAMPNHAIVHE